MRVLLLLYCLLYLVRSSAWPAFFDAELSRNGMTEDSYESLPLEGKFAFITKQLDRLNITVPDNFNISGDPVIEELRNFTGSTVRYGIIKRYLDENLARYRNEAQIQDMINKKKEDLEKNKPNSSEDVQAILLTEGLMDSFLAPMVFSLNQMVVKEKLEKLLKESKGTALEKKIQSKLNDFESMDVTDMMRPAREVMHRGYGQTFKDFYDITKAVESHLQRYAHTDEAQKLIAGMSEERRNVFEQLKLFAKEYREKLQEEIDSIDTKEIENKVAFLKKSFGEYKNMVASWSRCSADDVERIRRDQIDFNNNMLRHEIRKHVLAKYQDTYTIKAKVRDYIVEKQDDLDWEKPKMSQNLKNVTSTYMSRSVGIRNFELKQKQIKGELTDQLELYRGTKMQNLVESKLAEVESMNITEIASQRMQECFTDDFRNFKKENYERVMDALRMHWNLAETTGKGRRTIASLNREGKKINDEMREFEKDYSKEVQQEIDAIEAREKSENAVYALLSAQEKWIRSEVLSLRNDFENLADKIRLESQDGLEDLERSRGDQYDFIDASLRHTVLAHIYAKFRQNHTNNAKSKALIAKKVEALVSNKPRMTQSMENVFSGGMVQRYGSIELHIKKSEIENKLKQLMEQSQGTKLQKLVESTLSEVESLNIANMFKHGMNEFTRDYKTVYKQEFETVIDALRSHWSRKRRDSEKENIDRVVKIQMLYKEPTEYGHNMTEERNRFFEELRVFENENKKKLQKEIDAGEHKEKENTEKPLKRVKLSFRSRGSTN